MKFTVAIPTYNRPDDLKICLDSIVNQSLLPEAILIIDDGELSSDFLSEYKSPKIDIIKKNTRGTSESRNKALSLCQTEIIFILDDDLVLDPDFFSSIMRDWIDDSKLIGVGGVITNNRIKSWLETIYNKFFLLSSNISWDVNNLGFQVWDDDIKILEKGYYFHGGAASYKKDLVLNLGGFTSFGHGRSALEDVDFCMRAKQAGYYFLIEPQAKTLHNQSEVSREKVFLAGIKESVNRKIIFKKHCAKSMGYITRFVWANTGWIIRQFLAGHFSKGMGLLYGFIKQERL